MKNTMGKYWDKSWNPLKAKGGGYYCTKCSIGCRECWAEKYNLRFGNKQPYDDRQVEYILDENVLQQPLDRKKPTTYFVCDLCDLFHPKVPFEFINKVFNIICLPDRHTFLLLTKRIKRAAEYFKIQAKRTESLNESFVRDGLKEKCIWPWPNVHLGVTICNPDELWKITELCRIWAAYRWISFEPLLEDVGYISPYLTSCREDDNDLDEFGRHIDWVVVGCESGPKRRRCESAWVRDIVRQCKAAGVPCYVKQLSINGKVSHHPAEWPEDLRVRERIG